jgi:hypothetical protein
MVFGFLIATAVIPSHHVRPVKRGPISHPTYKNQSAQNAGTRCANACLLHKVSHATGDGYTWE